MPRGRRRSTADVGLLEKELNELKRRQAEVRQQIRRLRNSQTEVRKLEEKVEKQLAYAKWTIQQIKDLNPQWDEQGFYDSVEPKAPAPRGRRRRTEEPAAPTEA